MSVFLGIDIGGTNIKLGLVKDNGEIQVSGKIPTRGEEGPSAAASRVKEWFIEHCIDRQDAKAAGIGCAGLIDGKGGFLHVSPNLRGWENVPLAEVFTGELSLPAFLDNDVNCAAYGEFRKGAGKGTKYFICMTMGTGLGGGIIIDGSLYRGSRGFAGEIGHTVVLAGGPGCSCGSKGCLEALVGAGAIVDRARGLLGGKRESMLDDNDDLTVEMISKAAFSGDKLAAKVFKETGRFLGIGIANLVHLFNPEVIAIGGGVAGAGDFLFEPARKSFREHVMDDILADARIVPAQLGNKASFLGAAFLAMEGAAGASV